MEESRSPDGPRGRWGFQILQSSYSAEFAIDLYVIDEQLRGGAEGNNFIFRYDDILAD